MLEHKVFPIKTDTACQLKWTWSTLFLTTGTTSSCHRTNLHRFDYSKFDFHNTPSKLDDRTQMLNGNWPRAGCDYCRKIEDAGGQSDRITNLDFPGVHAPPELDTDPRAVRVTPRILEVYFDNVCNLKCLYCGSHFSSLWDAENSKFGTFEKDGVRINGTFVKSQSMQSNKEKFFDWLKHNRQHVMLFNVLGGEPLFQSELEECLDFFEKYPAPGIKLQIFTNLNAKLSHVKKIVGKVKKLIDRGCIKEFEVTASLDCWGAPQEYVRFPLDLTVWEENFNYLLSEHWINLIINSTLTPLTIKTFPELLEKVNTWNQQRPVYHYQNSVANLDYMAIDMFGDIFKEDFDRAIALKPSVHLEQQQSKRYLEGIAAQSCYRGPQPLIIKKLQTFLTEMDRRRNTHWPTTFPWLVEEFNKYNRD